MPEQPQLSWADRIAASKSTTFKPLDWGRYNFEITGATVKENTSGNSIQLKISVLDGERKNFKTQFFTNPEWENPWAFLQLFEAVGFGLDWLKESDPSIHEIASNLVGRKFSADVQPSKRNNDKGEPWPDFKSFTPVQPVVGSEEAQPQEQSQTQPQSQSFNAPAQAPQQNSPSPWNTPTESKPSGISNPF